MTTVSNLKISAYRNGLTYLEQNWANWPRRMENNHLTRYSRNHVEKQSNNRDMDLSQIATIHSIIFKGPNNRGYCPRVPGYTFYNTGACLCLAYGVSRDRYPVRPQPRLWWAPGLSWVGSHRMCWSMIPQRCSIRFRYGERAGHSMVSMPSSSKNRWHTLSTWGRALSSTRGNPGLTAPA